MRLDKPCTTRLAVIVCLLICGIAAAAGTRLLEADKIYAAGDAYVDITNDPANYLIGNNRVQFKVSKTNGYLSDIYNKITTRHYKSSTAGSFPFALGIGNSFAQIAITATSPSTISVSSTTVTSPSASSKQLQITYPNLRFSPTSSSNISATVRFIIADGAEYIKYNITFDNSSGSQAIRSIATASGGMLSASDTKGNEVLAVPNWEGGVLLDNPTASPNFTSTQVLGYPGPSLLLANINVPALEMGWIDLYDKTGSGGIGVAYIDKQKLAMEFRLLSQGSGMSIEPVLFDPSAIINANNITATTFPTVSLAAGASFTTDNTIIAPHSGDWHTMADIYRSEYQGSFVDGSSNPDYLTWDAVSSEAKAVDYSFRYWIMLEGTLLNKFNTIAAAAQAQADFLYNKKGASGANGLIWITGQNATGYAGDVPIQIPANSPAGGDSAMHTMNIDLSSKGFTVMHYNHPWAVDPAGSGYIPAADPGQHKEDWNKVTHFAICPNHTDVQNLWNNSIIPTWADYDIDGMLFDQGSLQDTVCNLAGYPQDGVSRLQSHINAVDTMVKNVRANLIPGGGAFTMTEGGNDLTARHIDIWATGDYLPPAWGGTRKTEITQYTAPQYIRMYAYNTDSPNGMLAAVNGGYAQGGLTLQAQEYTRFKTALRVAAAPGYPYGFKDTIGLTTGDPKLVARAFTDGSRVTVAYYANQAVVNSYIDVDLEKLGFGGKGVVRVYANLEVNHGDFAIIDPATTTASGFRDDFGANLPAGAATNWTTNGGTWLIATDGGNVYQQTNDLAGFNTTVAGNSAWTDTSAGAKVKFNTSVITREMSLLLRYSDDSNFVRLVVQANRWGLQDRSAGNWSSGVFSNTTQTTGSWYNVRFQVVGNMLYGKLWADGSSEPSGWQLSNSFTSTTALKQGKFGLSSGFDKPSFDNVVVGPATRISDDFEAQSLGLPLNDVIDNFDSNQPNVVGGAAAGWTANGGSWKIAEIEYNKVYSQTNSGASLNSTVLGNSNWSDANISAIARFNTSAITREMSLLLRYSDDNNFVRLVIQDTRWGLQERSASNWGTGVFTNTISGSFTSTLKLQTDNWYAARLQVIGNTLYGKVWVAAAAEPPNWQLTYNFNSTPTLSHGVAGLSSALASVAFDNVVISPAIRFSDDFEADTSSNPAAGWTPNNGTWLVGVDGSNVYRQTNGSAGFSTTIAGQHKWTDGELRTKVKFNTSVITREMSLLLRYSDDSNFVRLVVQANRWGLQDRSAGNWSSGVFSNTTQTTGSWYNVHFQVVGNMLYGKLWAESDGEPSGWQLSYGFTLSSALKMGQVGLASTYADSSFDDVAYEPNRSPAGWSANVTYNQDRFPSDSTTNAGTWVISTDGSNVYKQTNRSADFSTTVVGSAIETDSVLEAKVKFNSDDPNREMSLLVRYSDDSNFVRLVIQKTLWGLQDRSAGNWGSGMFTNTALTVGSWYNVRFQVIGNTLYGKLWLASDPEPSGGQLSYSFATTTTLSTGKLGLSSSMTDPSFDAVTLK